MDHKFPLRTLLEFNTRQFHAAIDGIDDHRASRELGTSCRRIDHIAAHMIDARAHVARLLGVRPHLDILDVLEAVPTFEKLGDRVPLSALRDAWDLLTDPLRTGFDALTDEAFVATTDHQFPVDDPSLRGAITFFVQHEAYHLGQLGLLRRELGLPAIVYPEIER
jgi:uncharacterized damage-inducible protein DinB